MDGTFRGVEVEDAVVDVSLAFADEAVGGVNSEDVADVVETEISVASAFAMETAGDGVGVVDPGVPCVFPQVGIADVVVVFTKATFAGAEGVVNLVRSDGVLLVEGGFGVVVAAVSTARVLEAVPIVGAVAIPCMVAIAVVHGVPPVLVAAWI